jgi:ribosomal protein S18 acetylase RimI-like enzyme
VPSSPSGNGRGRAAAPGGNGREGRRIEVREVPEKEIGALWREARKTNLFPSRRLYREFFRELGGRAFTPADGPRQGLAIMGRWRGGSRLHCLWFISAGPGTSRELLAGAMEEYLREGEEMVTRMVDEAGAAFFEGSGFSPFQEIVLLEGDGPSMRIPAGPPPVRIRRFKADDLEGVLSVDAAAFDRFWRVDSWSVRCISRYCLYNRCVVAEEDGGVGGYSIAGTNGYGGFIQRLAVHPRFQGRGWGGALLGNQLAWMRSLGTRVYMVNTQRDNLAARATYLKAGFNRQAGPRYIYRYVRG